jgi:hypothetical protein
MISNAYNNLEQYDKGEEYIKKAMSKPKYQKHYAFRVELERSKEGLKNKK